MAIFAISDLHFSLASNKPMDVFGGKWEDHMEKVQINWRNTVCNEDVVLIAGDISWATYMQDAISDLKFIHSLPGTKIISRGNHDYWWGTIQKMQQILTENGIDSIKFIHNNSYKLDKRIFCGSRGWKLPSDINFNEEDLKIYKRELNRLELSLKNANKVKSSEDSIVAMLHYPPLSSNGEPSEFVDLMLAYGVDKCIYGHLHDNSHRYAVTGVVNNIEFVFTASDFLDFTPVCIYNVQY